MLCQKKQVHCSSCRVKSVWRPIRKHVSLLKLVPRVVIGRIRCLMASCFLFKSSIFRDSLGCSQPYVCRPLYAPSIENSGSWPKHLEGKRSDLQSGSKGWFLWILFKPKEGYPKTSTHIFMVMSRCPILPLAGRVRQEWRGPGAGEWDSSRSAF